MIFYALSSGISIKNVLLLLLLVLYHCKKTENVILLVCYFLNEVQYTCSHLILTQFLLFVQEITTYEIPLNV